MKNRLSSDYLYHFTGELMTLKLILQNGFRHSLISELLPNSPIPDRSFLQQNYLVCFCDIKPNENDFHRQCYGSNALAMSKHWGIKNGLSPVQYVHKNSSGTGQDYLQVKIWTRGLVNSEQAFRNYPELWDLLSRNFMVWSYLSDPKNNLTEREIEKLSDELIQSVKKVGKEELLRKFVLVMRNRIVNQNHYLEARDPFHRNYMEDFLCPNTAQIIKDKILYDEREWRSFIPSFEVGDAIITEFDNGIAMKGYLSSKHNLRFKDEDLIEIRLDKVEFKDDLFKFLKENTTGLDTDLTIDKVKLNE